jgi:hypothetical protein
MKREAIVALFAKNLSADNFKKFSSVAAELQKQQVPFLKQ